MKNAANKWPYLAGVFDGEGTIYIGKRKTLNQGSITFQIQLKVANTDLRLMEWLVQNFGGHYHVSHAREHLGHKTQYAWSPKGKNNRVDIYNGMLPYLVLKKEQILIGLEFDSMYGRNGCEPGLKLTADNPVYKKNLEKREELMLKLKALNHKGTN